MAGLNAFGTTLSRGSTEIANITSLSPPGVTRETLNVTSHDSPDGYMQFVGGLIDGGEVTADINWSPSLDSTATLLGDLEDPDPVEYTIDFPDGSSFTADLLITGFEPTANFDDKLTATLTFKVTGKPVFEAGS
jgi:predicted secreted protein